MAMKKAEAWDQLVQAVYDECHGHVVGWHGQQVEMDMTGWHELAIEEQLGFLRQMGAIRGPKRVTAERVSATGVNTLEKAQARAKLMGEDGLINCESGTRVGVSKLNSAEDCARAAVLSALKDEKSDKAKARREEFGLGLKRDKNDRVVGLTGTDSEAFQAYLDETAGKEPFLSLGQKEWQKRQAAREAQKGSKAAKAAL